MTGTDDLVVDDFSDKTSLVGADRGEPKNASFGGLSNDDRWIGYHHSTAHLRALAIHELTKHALNEDCPPAQRIKALELIGKMTEVALFTERREIVQVTDSDSIRARLMDTLRTITQAEAVDVEDTAAASLLAELAEPITEAQDTEAQADEAQDPETILNSTPPVDPHPPAA